MRSPRTVTLDKAGRLVVPKQLRDAAGLRPGVPIELALRDGRVVLQPLPRKVDLVRKGSLVVAVPSTPSEPLRPETVQETLQAIRNREV